ncbi:hypothetical protein ADIARSV_0874 [Arcticibacter svalbardensis MN12-7]|uniref:Outer membrane protein n=1 Tax=Arcticibacter svalbardensis MN12-7 TaxID=1150600 RepID=R9H411_9SPHI|nr:RagB/SusD family nutrient uptake outer membrane protein [Arcticibacter svalbardensis]EOR95924.1 hypothetical protein ADIARSV_0874 [Arcticibacter svalbardensis MN12-7]
MKTRIYKFLMICCLFSISACSDYLDVSDELAGGLTSTDAIFDNVSYTKRWYSNVFTGIPDYSMIVSQSDAFNEANSGLFNPWTSLTDEINSNGPYYAKMGIFDWNASTTNMQRWAFLYKLIRQANIFLEKAKVIEATGTNAEFLPAEDLALYKANVRFMRAYYYYLLMEQYGPVPLITTASALADDLDQERRPIDELVNFIDAELIEASKGMYGAAQTNENLKGVPTKGAALAVRAKLWIYAASPLFNGDFAEGLALPKTSDGKALFAPKDATKWAKAVTACRDFLDFAEAGNYSLFKEYTNSVYDPDKTIYDLFQVYNDEIIWANVLTGWGGMTGQLFDRRVTPICEPSGIGSVGVTQELVDDFSMKDGLPIKSKDYLSASPLYVEDGTTALYNGVQVNKMYLNREPRFYATVFFSGRKWHISNREVQFYLGGNADRTKSYYNLTGYALYKRFNRTVHMQAPGVSSKFRPSIIFRLAEFYLLYAEALNEVTPNDPNILKYVNLVRERAGIPNLEVLNPSIRGNQELQREAIRMESRIELATEGQRYFNVHRWMIAENEPGQGGEGGDFHGMNLDGNAQTFYQRTKFQTRIFKRKNYFFPIPLIEMQKSTKLIQNPGW